MNTGRIEAVQTPPAINSNTGRTGNTSYKKAVNDRIGTGLGQELKSTGVYVDVIYPQSSRQNPVSKTAGKFEAALNNVLENSSVDSTSEENSTVRNASSPTVTNGQNFVVTVPGAHMEKISQSVKQTSQSRLYDMYNSIPNRYTGSLVNVMA
ncbi:MAG: hypothetical protein ACM3Q2_18730 [Syntrophothermus sp.]